MGRNDSGRGGERAEAFLEHDGTWTSSHPDNELAAVRQSSPMSSQPPERPDSQTLRLLPKALTSPPSDIYFG